MNCEICTNEIGDKIVLLQQSQPDGRFEILVCISCAEKSEFYCLTHQRPHLGFPDSTSACMICIDEAVEQDGERLAGIFGVVIDRSSRAQEIQEAIQGWQRQIESMFPHVSLADLPLAIQWKGTPFSLNVIRTVVTRAKRMRVTPEEVINLVAQEGPEVILPPLDLDE